jgi:hypothetical protein
MKVIASWWLCVLSLTRFAAGATPDQFEALFNGRDLSGWTNVNCAPETWSVSNGTIHCTGRPIGALRTLRQYENFIFEAEWRHLSAGGNSGIFIWASPIAAPGVPFLRGIEVQVLDNGYDVKGRNEWYTTHGDVFPIHGATMKPFGRHNGMRAFPSEELSRSSPEWNSYRVVCSNGVIRLHVNGKEVSGGEDCNYRKGYLGLESEGAPVEFRNLRLRELPSNNAGSELSAPKDPGCRSLFTGLDLRGWKTNGATLARWGVAAEHIVSREGVPMPNATLWTESEFSDFQLVLDARLAKSSPTNTAALATLQVGAKDGKGTEVYLEGLKPGVFQRFLVTLKGKEVTVKSEGKETRTFPLDPDARVHGPFGLVDRGGAVEFMNLYVRDL